LSAAGGQTVWNTSAAWNDHSRIPVAALTA
jgi:hypothetical protein